MADSPATLQSLFTFAFVVNSMLAMGLWQTVAQIPPPSNLPRGGCRQANRFGRRGNGGPTAVIGSDGVSRRP